MKLCQLFTQGLGARVGIEAQAFVNSRANRAQDFRGRGIRILVRVQLDEALDFRLFTRDIRVQFADQWTNQTKRILHWRIVADAACASSPSTSANFWIARRDFFR